MRIKIVLSLAAIITGLTFNYAQAQDDLVYVAVEPCRIVDTRASSMGFINGNTSRNFSVYGTAEELAVQGVQGACSNPKNGLEPVAVAAYVVATPGDSSPTSNGVVTAYPAGNPIPPAGTGATLNFNEGDTIGNTSIVTLCKESCPPDGTLAVLVRNTDYHVVIDVQGYYYAGTSGVAFSGPDQVVLTNEEKTSVANLVMTAPQDGFLILNYSGFTQMKGLQSINCEIVEGNDKIPQRQMFIVQSHFDTPQRASSSFGFTAGYPVPKGPLNIGVLCSGDEGIIISSTSLTAVFSSTDLTTPPP